MRILNCLDCNIDISNRHPCTRLCSYEKAKKRSKGISCESANLKAKIIQLTKKLEILTKS